MLQPIRRQRQRNEVLSQPTLNHSLEVYLFVNMTFNLCVDKTLEHLSAPYSLHGDD